MGFFDQAIGSTLVQARQMYVERHFDAESVTHRADADFAGDRGIGGEFDLFLAGYNLHCPDEAGRVTRGE